MRINYSLALAGVIVVGLGIGAGVGALRSSPSQAAPAAASITANVGGGAAGNSSGSSFGNSSGASADPGQATVSGATGVVEKVGTQEFTLKPGTGSTSVTVRLNDQTVIRKQVAGTLADIKPGEAISAQGETGTDGTTAATSVQLVAADGAGTQSQGGMLGQMSGMRGQFGGQFGGQAGQAGRGTQGQAATGIVFGTVESVANNVVSVTRPGGATAQGSPVKITISDKTAITKTATGDIKDIKEGVNVVAVGPRGADGVVTASSVQILPPDAPQARRQQ